MGDGLVVELFEEHVRLFGERCLFVFRPQADAGIHRVAVARQAPQHGNCFVAVGRFAHHFPVVHHYRIGRHQHRLAIQPLCRTGCRLAAGQVLCHRCRRQGRAQVLVHVERDEFHRVTQRRQQLTPAGRLRGQKQLHFTSRPFLNLALYISRPLSYHTHFPSFSPATNCPFSTGAPASL